MKEGLNRLISSFNDSLKRVQHELNRHLKRCVVFVPVSTRLLMPLVSVELVIYVAIILVVYFFCLKEQRNNSSLLTIEIFVLIPIIFVYCDWKLCEELFDSRKNLLRFQAILERIQYACELAFM